MISWRTIVVGAALLSIASAQLGCAAPKSKSGDILAASLTDLMPHGDRDHFVYASEKTVGELQVEKALTVEHVSKLDTPGEFQVTESTDGIRMGDSRWLSDDAGISLVSEDVEGLGVRLAYSPPLLIFPAPLRAGEHHATAVAAATRLDDGQDVGSFRVSVVVQSDSIRAQHPLAAGAPAVSLRVTRSLQGPGGALVLHVNSVNAEGVGEVESVAALEGMPVVVRRSLVCGFIQGRAVGKCNQKP